jgi:hypothetical protein
VAPENRPKVSQPDDNSSFMVLSLMMRMMMLMVKQVSIFLEDESSIPFFQ